MKKVYKELLKPLSIFIAVTLCFNCFFTGPVFCIDSQASDLAETTYLSDLAYRDYANGADFPLGIDKNISGTALAVKNTAGNDVTFTKGIGMHAFENNDTYAYVTYDISGKGYSRFLCYAAADLNGWASVTFEVEVDGVTLYQNSVMNVWNNENNYISVDVSGASTLTLRVGNGQNGNNGDHADWCDARLIRMPASVRMQNGVSLKVKEKPSIRFAADISLLDTFFDYYVIDEVGMLTAPAYKLADAQLLSETDSAVTVSRTIIKEGTRFPSEFTIYGEPPSAGDEKNYDTAYTARAYIICRKKGETEASYIYADTNSVSRSVSQAMTEWAFKNDVNNFTPLFFSTWDSEKANESFCKRYSLDNKYSPDKKIMNYFCTWAMQAATGGNATAGRDMLNHEVLFGENGWCNTLYPKTRSSMLFLLDDGWELPNANGNPAAHNPYYGSQLVFEDKFPNYGSTPEERLTTLANNVRDCGWGGVGIWICAGEQASVASGLYPGSYDRDYWTERLIWSKNAGINYWKVDWGRLDSNNEWRKWLTDTARQLYPQLIIEHTSLENPLNDALGNGRMTSEKLAKNISVLSFSDIYRTYDVTWVHSSATTFDRVGEMLAAATPQQGVSKGYLNSEDEVYMGAVLGLNLGIMRHPYDSESKDEVTRAVRWQKIAPAFSAASSTNRISSSWLSDEWDFTANDTWQTEVVGKRIAQRAPAAIARNTELPVVTGSESIPFVATALNPNGTFAVGTYVRTSPGNPRQMYKADVTVNAGYAQTIGVFGEYNSLKIKFNGSLENIRIYASDLLSYRMTDVTDNITISGQSLILSGKFIHAIGLSSATAGDSGKPGLILKIQR